MKKAVYICMGVGMDGTVSSGVDCDRTNVGIHGWRDLAVVKEEVGFADPGMQDLFLSGMAYGLAGENHTFTDVVDLVAT